MRTKRATCHPQKPHRAFGLCDGCYTRAKRQHKELTPVSNNPISNRADAFREVLHRHATHGRNPHGQLLIAIVARAFADALGAHSRGEDAPGSAAFLYSPWCNTICNLVGLEVRQVREWWHRGLQQLPVAA